MRLSRTPCAQCGDREQTQFKGDDGRTLCWDCQFGDVTDAVIAAQDLGDDKLSPPTNSPRKRSFKLPETRFAVKPDRSRSPAGQ